MFCLFVVKQYILARVAGDRADKKKDAKGRRLVDRGSVYSIGFASSHRPTTHAGLNDENVEVPNICLWCVKNNSVSFTRYF